MVDLWVYKAYNVNRHFMPNVAPETTIGLGGKRVCAKQPWQNP